jgi:hypothetical protein
MRRGTTTSRNAVEISATEFGKEWPFTVERGTLACVPPGSNVVFTANGVTYALNGRARGAKRWAEIDPIRRTIPIEGSDEPLGASVSAVIARGIRLCEQWVDLEVVGAVLEGLVEDRWAKLLIQNDRPPQGDGVDDNKTTTDALILKIKNYKIASWVIVISILLVGVGQVLDVYRIGLELWTHTGNQSSKETPATPEATPAGSSASSTTASPVDESSAQSVDCIFLIFDTVFEQRAGSFGVSVDGSGASGLGENIGNIVAVLRNYNVGESVPVSISWTRARETVQYIRPRRPADEVTTAMVPITSHRYILVSRVRGPSGQQSGFVIKTLPVTADFLQHYATRAGFAMQPKCIQGSGVFWWSRSTSVDSTGRNLW